MKKIILALFLITALLSNASAQSLMKTQEWHDLITNLQNENWPEANALSLSLLDKSPKNEPDDFVAALLRYMYIHSEAGLLNMNKVSKSEALKAVIRFKGQLIILPPHPVVLKDHLNGIQLADEKTDTLFLASTNKAGTEIFGFAYFILGDKWPLEDFKNSEGKFYRLGGIIKSIDVEGNMFPRFKIYVEKAIYNSFEQ